MLKVLHFKRIVEKQALGKIARSRKGFVPNHLKKAYSVAIRTLRSREIATFEHKEKVTSTHIIFLHGGAYIFEASPYHWKLVQKIVDKRFCRMTLVDYPLAPEHDYRETFEMVEGAYDMLVSTYPNDHFFLMGDSAGAGLALALSQKLALDNYPKPPAGNILLSPWLDLTMSNPEIEKLKHSDHILSVEMLRYAGLKYSNGDNPDHYLLSPINGVFKGLPKTIIFYGTEELFYADCIKLRSMVASVNEAFVFSEYPGMPHDWAMLPIPERDRVVDEICAIIEE
ncbi:MAG: alpha/beta hydrolase fold domain-containing protein [Saprospirales bacterium]|nr:alpha/beta hydrolase fold domain-containing protein [Saprospirales bacterium]